MTAGVPTGRGKTHDTTPRGPSSTLPLPLTLTTGARAIRLRLMQVRILTWRSLEEAQRQRILSRSETDISSVVSQVAPILERVRREGDAALIHYTRQFNGADLTGKPLRVSESELDEAEAGLSAP